MAVVTAIGLCRQSTRPHAKESEHPVQHVEHGAANGYGAKINGRADVACYGRIGQAEQWSGYVRSDGRKGYRKDFTVQRPHRRMPRRFSLSLHATS